MFLSIHYSHGICTEGQVSTGKTETTKEIAKYAGKMCFLFNCSGSLNYDSMIKFFKGFVSGGSWTCFDEFNRIQLSLMQVISQTIMQVHATLRMQKTEILFDDGSRAVHVNPSCAIFVTMNTNLKFTNTNGIDMPNSLANRFRSVQMVRPDSKLIIENMLLCNGFGFYKELASKVVRTFQSASQQLGTELSYDFSLRSMCGVLLQAAQWKREISGVSESEEADKFKVDE